MNDTQKATAKADERFLAAIIDELNARVPGESTLAELDAAVTRRRIGRLSATLDAEMVADGARQWRDYWAAERQRIGDLFRTLAKSGRLSRADADDLLETVELGTEFKLRTGFNAGSPFIKPEPVFKTFDARVAYVIVRLAADLATPFRVICCKHCDTLKLIQLKKKRGRPTSDFCSLAHGHAYASAQTRIRQKLKAAKHK